MPQAKGAANWLTNVRQPMPSKRATFCDDSTAKIINDNLEKRVTIQIDEIHKHRHRKLADRAFELRQTSKDVQTYGELQNIIQTSSFQKAFENYQRPQQMKQVTIPLNRPGKARFTLAASGSNFSAAGSRQRPKTSVPGFRKVDSDYDSGDDGGFAPFSARATPTHGKATPSQERLRALTALPRRRARRSRKEILATVEREGASSGERPETSLSMARPWTSASSYKEFDGAFQAMPPVSRPVSTKVPGRSFQELKNLTNVDSICNSQRTLRRELAMQRREEELQERKELLREKIELFYYNLHKFQQQNVPLAERKIKVLKSTVYD